MRPIHQHVIRLAGAGAFLILLIGCTLSRDFVPQSPTAAGFQPNELIDPTAYGGQGPPPHVFKGLFEVAEKVRESNKPEVIPPKRAALILSGGGSYGAYTAGVLVGWSEMGTRPSFDVVTGVSTGALIAALAFLGPEYDGELRRLYTTLNDRDIFVKKPPLRALFSDSLADNSPLEQRIQEVATPEFLKKIGAEHEKGRRLYVGTTDLEGRRAVVWDLGAIALRGDRELFCKLLLASAAIPGFFPATEIPVLIDGQPYTERHVDGGLTQPLFFRPPYIPPEQRCILLPEILYGSDEYVIVAGKLYVDPQVVEPRFLKIVGNSVSTFLYAQTRDALVKIYMQSMLCGMHFNLAHIPEDYPAPKSSTSFDPIEMCKMFEVGRMRVRTGVVWRNTPPGVGGGEELLLRAGNKLTYQPNAVHIRSGRESPPSLPQTTEEGIPIPKTPIAK